MTRNVVSPSTISESDTLSLLSPETRLVLLTAGSAANDHRIRELLRQNLDWARVSAIAQWEKATSVIWRRLSAVTGATKPTGMAEYLQNLASVAEFRLMHLQQRLEESLGALQIAGIDVLLLKGAALRQTVYSSIGERPMSDIDLLVRPEQEVAARNVLLSEGWARDEDATTDTRYAEHHHQPPLHDARGTGVKLEVHRSLFSKGHPFRFSTEEVWRSARLIPVAQTTALVPSDDHVLLHAVLHFAWSHQFLTGAWRTFRDIAAIVGATGDGWNWARFTALASDSRGGTCCYWTLRLARDLSAVEVPEAVLEELRPPLPEAVLRRLERHLAFELFPPESICPSVQLGHAVWRMAIFPRRSGHGVVRPWDFEQEQPHVGEERKASPNRFLNHFKNAGSWGRYIAVIGRQR